MSIPPRRRHSPPPPPRRLLGRKRSEEALPFLFQPLYRVDGSRNRALGGSGLGLAIAQRIAIAHGGTLIAAASPLGGLQMELRLPLEAA